MDALLRAGGIECALEDARHPAAVPAAAMTDAIARSLCCGREIPSSIAADRLPEPLSVTTPEGYAYYALDPLAYAKVAGEIAKDKRGVVVGIRSAGVTLAAVCAAVLGCTRITVRPHGHPYDREVRLDEQQRALVVRERPDVILIVDEGPGLSGSSFLATAEAVERCGIPASFIIMLGSHAVDANALVARDAARRWARLSFRRVAAMRPPADSRPFRDWDWRAEWLSAERWPATWPAMTPPKYLSNDGAIVWKFEGLSRFGDAVRDRARLLGDARLSPELEEESNGFSGYQVVKGKIAPALSAALMDSIARYCALRADRMAAAPHAGLDEMVAHNAEQLRLNLRIAPLPIVRPAICDARMVPHEWLQDENGKIWKTDAVSHGDNHFYPGPTDIAWDLAGAIMEWRMDEAAESRFLEQYRSRSGDDARSRLNAYKLAYCIFQMSYARMAATSLAGTEESVRFHRDEARYRNRLVRLSEGKLAQSA